MSSKLPRIIVAASLWLVVLTLSVSPAMADPNDLFAPVFVNRPQGTLNFSHCDTARYTFQAVSAATGLPSPFVRYRIVSGPGSIDSVTGTWRLGPTMSPDSLGTYQVEIAAREFALETEGLQNCFATIRMSNYTPYLYLSSSPSTISGYVNETVTAQFEHYDYDQCDTSVVTVKSITPAFAGIVATEGNDRLFSVLMTPSPADSGKMFLITLSVTDGLTTTTNYFRLQVMPPSFYSIRIGVDSHAIQGVYTQLPILLDRKIPDMGVSGFDFLIAYDHRALVLQRAMNSNSPLYTQCKWEYFTYRYGSNGNCYGDCPVGLVRVVGIAETNNGNAHPTCGPENLPTLPVEMCRLEFFIRGDTALDCSFYPVRFFFVDCSDNSIASSDGNTLFLEDSVFQKGSGPDDNLSITDHLVPPPSYFGIPSSCVTYTPKTKVVRGIHLFGGGVRVICPDSSGNPTDVNEDNSSLPMEFALHQNYPNPFNPSTTISFDLPHAAEVNVEIVNVLGQVVWSRQERMGAGTQVITWNGVRSDGSPVSSGMYYYRLTAHEFAATKKMILMK